MPGFVVIKIAMMVILISFLAAYTVRNDLRRDDDFTA